MTNSQCFQCLAGCGLYIVNQTMGQTIRSLVGPLYVMFENCIQKGMFHFMFIQIKI